MRGKGGRGQAQEEKKRARWRREKCTPSVGRMAQGQGGGGGSVRRRQVASPPSARLTSLTSYRSACYPPSQLPVHTRCTHAAARACNVCVRAPGRRELRAQLLRLGAPYAGSVPNLTSKNSVAPYAMSVPDTA
eukprot:3353220-Rhodomonas_salina.1